VVWCGVVWCGVVCCAVLWLRLGARGRDKQATMNMAQREEQRKDNKTKHTHISLLDINHLPRTRLHEPTPPVLRPLAPVLHTDLPQLSTQVTLVPHYHLNRRHGSISTSSTTNPSTTGAILSILSLHGNHTRKVREAVQRGRGGDVVDEEEGVGLQGGAGEEAAVFFLPGGVADGEVVGAVVDGAGYGVAVFDGGVVSRREVSRSRGK